MQDKQRRAVRSRQEQLLTLLNGWDPAGLLEAGAPRDQYAFLVDKLLDLLSRRVSKEEVAAFLETEVDDHFGKPPREAAQFAAKAVTWFELLSDEAE